MRIKEHKPKGRLAVALASALLFLLGVSSAAAAEQPHTFTESFGSPGTGAGQFNLTSESSIAIDQSNGDVYVADTGNHRVEKFSPTGAFLFAFGWGVKTGDTAATGLDQCTTECQAGFPGHEPGQFEEPTFIAVDNTPHGEGDVYVANNGAVGNERQTVTVGGATGGSFTLSFTDVIHGTTTEGSNLLTHVWGPTATVDIGAGISGPGIPLGTTIAGRPATGTLELSADAIATAASVELGVTGTSSSIKSGAGASEVQSALEHVEALEGNISVSGSAGGPYTVEFLRELAGVNVRQMACEGSAGATCTVATAADGFNAHSVQKFDSSGNLITTWGGSPAGGELDGSACSECVYRPHFAHLSGVAVIPPVPGVLVKPKGSLLVVDCKEEATEWSQSSGEFVYHPGTYGVDRPTGVAVDPADHVYLGKGGLCGDPPYEVIQTSYCDREDPFGQCPGKNVGEGFGYHENFRVDPGPDTGVAVDPVTEDVYVARFNPFSNHSDVAGYDSSGEVLEGSFGGNGEIVRSAGVAASGFGGSEGEVYVADVGANRVEVFAPGGSRDVLTVTRSGSGLGSVSSAPAGIACPSTCATGFPEGEVVTLTATAPEHSSFVGWSGGGCAGTGACQITFTAATAVTATFAYDRPAVSVAPAVAVTRHTATLTGTVNPEGDASSCFFEYGTTGAYGAQAPCSSHPGSGAGPVPVSAELWELATSTTYHYRLVSANSGGTAYGSDETFTTFGEGCASNLALCPALPAASPIATVAVVPPKSPAITVKALTNARKLTLALAVCRKQRQRSVRVKCEKQAQRRYAPAKKKPKKSTRSGKRG